MIQHRHEKEHIKRKVVVAGEYFDEVGGGGADNSFLSLSNSSSCGKMTALAKLLDLWYHQGTANKVCQNL